MSTFTPVTVKIIKKSRPKRDEIITRGTTLVSQMTHLSNRNVI
jgi:hypothetical protein